MKRIVFFIFLLLSVISAHAEEAVQFVASTSNIVAVGQRFKVVFSLKNGSADNIQVADFDEAFEVLMGPNVSRGKSISMINGQTTVTENSAYTYILSPKKEGTFTIAPARVTVNGKTYMSNALTVKVLPAESNPQGGTAQQQARGGNANTQQQVGVSDNDLFVKTELSRTKVYEQEQIIATIRLYYRANVRSLDEVKLPEFKGCIAQEIELNDDQKYGMDAVNGKNYKTVILKQMVLFPQKSGKLKIESGKLSAIVQVPVTNQRRGGIFDDFFSSYADVKKPLNVPGVTIDVMPLPEVGKPADFSGAVGDFQLSSNLTNDHVKANEAVNLKLKISGTGNLKYLKTPELKFPQDFEVYDPKTDTKQSITKNGVSGSKSVEYIAIPRYDGEFNIPAVSFSYFDVKTKKYKTLTSPEYTLTVEKGDAPAAGPVVSNYSNKQNVKMLDKDLRYVNTKDLALQEKGDFFYASTSYWMALLIPLMLSIAAFFAYKKYLSDNSDLVLVKNKRANKQAKKRLKVAESHIASDNKSAFYEEVVKAMWGYVGDKLNISVSDLSRDNVESELKEHSVSSDTIANFIKLIDKCEFARYAPSQQANALNVIYEEASNIIEKLEQEVTAIKA
ncbi:MAG: BatD family protein [Paludibacteraceae bacterium]|nr:BatD family protein [Paludibacteraceae bacterium]